MSDLHDTAPDIDYLWDRSGPPDPEVAGLESLLSTYRLGASAPAHRPARATVEASRPPSIEQPLRPRRWPAAAAMIALAVSAALLAHRPPPAWDVRAVHGGPKIDSRTLAGRGALRVGEWMHTDASSRALIRVADLGEVEVAPGSRVRIKEAGASRKLLELQHGQIHAFITAPPEVFLVDTPWARAVDLGCEYTLTVDNDGAGVLRVDLGYVMLRGQGRESTVPMNGGMCLTRPGRGPGTPFFETATPRFKSELERFDFASGGRGALDAVLAEARPPDTLSLWHLLSRTSGPDREDVLDRIAALKPIPDTIERHELLALDAGALGALWNELRPF